MAGQTDFPARVNINGAPARRVGAQVTQSTFTDGSDENESISAGNVGTIMEAEIGSTGNLANYRGVSIVSTKGIDPADKQFVDLETSTDGTDVDDRTEFRWGLRRKSDQGSTLATYTPWMSVRRQDKSDPRQIPGIPLLEPTIGSDGRVLIFQVKNEATSVTVHRSNSVVEYPIVGYE